MRNFNGVLRSAEDSARQCKNQQSIRLALGALLDINGNAEIGKSNNPSDTRK